MKSQYGKGSTHGLRRDTLHIRIQKEKRKKESEDLVMGG
jgi:hypothetical protein